MPKIKKEKETQKEIKEIWFPPRKEPNFLSHKMQIPNNSWLLCTTVIHFITCRVLPAVAFHTPVKRHRKKRHISGSQNLERIPKHKTNRDINKPNAHALLTKTRLGMRTTESDHLAIVPGIDASRIPLLNLACH